MSASYFFNCTEPTDPQEQKYLAELKAALKKGEFVPWYQPQYDYTLGKIVSSEALVRRVQSDGTVVPPGRFIPLMEATGLISALDRDIWEQIARQLQEWRNAGVPVLPVSLNISRRDLTLPDTVSFLSGLLTRYNIPPRLLRLEITESAYMDDSELLSSSIAALRSAGFLVEIDDFGSGFSSLNMLKDIQVDVLKLDMGFLSGNSSRGGTILSSVLSMARNLDLDVIAEGVETKPQADYLHSLGCIVMQGYLFYRPTPEEEFKKLLCSGAALSTPDSLKAGRGVGNAVEFLDANTQATLLFNSFLGGAAIIEQFRDSITFLRTNDRFFSELGIERSVFSENNFFSSENFSSRFHATLLRALDAAYEADEEKSVELRAERVSSDYVWLRAGIRFLAEKQENRIFYLSIENITARHQLQERNRRLSSELTAMVNSVPDGLARLRVVNGIGTFEFVNETLANLFDRDPGTLLIELLANPLSFVHPDDRDYVRQAFDFSFSTLSPIHIQFRSPLRGGKYRIFDLNGTYGVETEDALLYLSVSDITELLKAESELRRTQAEFDSAIEQSGLMICRYRPKDRALVVSEATARRFDSVMYMPDVRESMVREGYVARESAADWDRMFEDLENARPGACAALCLKNLHNRWKWYSVTWRPLLFEGQLDSAILCFRDITAEKIRSDSQRHELDRLRKEESEVRQLLRRNGVRDDLTGLNTRGTAEALIASLLSEKKRKTALFILADMDDLKTVNDTYGHAEGDEALRRISDLLSSHFARKNAVTARLGGDEFLVFIPDPGNSEEQISLLDSFFVKLSRIRIGPGKNIPSRCSLGCVLSQPDSGDTFRDLYIRADQALYHVKRTLKNYFVFWSPSMEESKRERGTDTVLQFRQADLFDPGNMGSLLDLLGTSGLMVCSVNFDRDQYYLLDTSPSFVKNLPRFGTVRELLPLFSAGSGTDPEEYEHFLSSVRNDFSAGRTVFRTVSVQEAGKADSPQRSGGDSSQQQIETVLQLYLDRSGDFCAFTLSREADGSHLPRL